MYKYRDPDLGPSAFIQVYHLTYGSETGRPTQQPLTLKY